MKAPDVIYVEFSEEVNLAFEKQPFAETPAYIRKEALLEWLNRMLEISAQSFAFQRNYAYGKVIDKINEM